MVRNEGKFLLSTSNASKDIALESKLGIPMLWKNQFVRILVDIFQCELRKTHGIANQVNEWYLTDL
jgi:hypothetical protein